MDIEQRLAEAICSFHLDSVASKNRHAQIIVLLDRRTYPPVLRQADLPDIRASWLDHQDG